MLVNKLTLQILSLTNLIYSQSSDNIFYSLSNNWKLKFYCFFIVLICCSIPTFGQIITDVPVVDIDVDALEVKAYCQPGVKNKSRSKGLEIAYGNRGSGRLTNSKQDPGDLNNDYSRWDNLRIKLKAPILLKENFKILIGYKYYQEGFNFTEIGSAHFPVISNLDEFNLKSSSFSLTLNKSLNERSYVALQLKYSVSGNFSGLGKFSDRYATYRALGVYGVKPSNDFEWGIALNVSKNFRRFNVIPFLLLNKNFSPKWGLEALLPGFIFMRHNISPSNIMLGGIEFGNKNFRLDIPQEGAEDLDFAYNQSHLKAVIKYQRRIIPWLWAGAEVGYQYNLNTRFEAKNVNTTSFFLRANNAPYFRVSIFVSPHSKEDKMLQSFK